MKTFVIHYARIRAMTTFEFHILTTADHEEALSNDLSELGCAAVTCQDAGDEAIYEPDPGEYRQWKKTLLIALINDELLLTDIEIYLNEQKKNGLIDLFHKHALSEQDWVRHCLDQFTPLQFGARLWICPSWIAPPDPLAVNVILDPGFAFGTGTHSTTALCLAWLDTAIHGGETVIDYGCGSGILGVAALKLGASQVIAVDHDPQALDATRLNAERNALTEDQLKIVYPHDFKPEKVDVLIANILAKPLIELAAYFANCVKPGGKIALSGILDTQADEVMQAYAPWFDMLRPVSKLEWVRLEGLRRA